MSSDAIRQAIKTAFYEGMSARCKEVSADDAWEDATVRHRFDYGDLRRELVAPLAPSEPAVEMGEPERLGVVLWTDLDALKRGRVVAISMYREVPRGGIWAPLSIHYPTPSAVEPWAANELESAIYFAERHEASVIIPVATAREIRALLRTRTAAPPSKPLNGDGG